jgi:hypothetical protein
VNSAKKMLTVTSDPEGCWPRAPAICDDPHATLLITGIGQFSAALVGEVNKTLVRGVHCPGPQPPIRWHHESGAHMLMVQSQAKQVVSSGLPLAVVVARGDLQVTLSIDQTKIHRTSDRVQVPQGRLSPNEMHKSK